MSVLFLRFQLQGPRAEAAITQTPVPSQIPDSESPFANGALVPVPRVGIGSDFQIEQGFPAITIKLDRRASIPHRPPPLPLLIIHRLDPFKQMSSKRARKMDHRLPRAVPAVRLSSRLQLATTFGAGPAPRGARRGSRGPPPTMTADVRVVIRRQFPVVGPGGTRIAEKVAVDIALRRRPSSKLRLPESVERALADEVLALVAHPFDRGAVVAARNEICTYVAAACDDQRIVRGGARVLVLIDTFACPVVFRSPPCKPAPQRVVCAPGNLVAPTATQRMDLEITMPTKKQNPYGVIGDRRPKPVVEEAPKLEVFGTMAGWTDSFSIFRS
ncbi:hypothetical protein GQ55_9G492600 [Panicum hallii var. hallii]|uniref:Uncharacterized protein n=1 Tax=Panicum hallii var. hallii TaxID=1504633 RepID=A0A2T7CD78_9POAL|nr:hypothetical protein GQ55_9G492600 [Panicum hallii var. hallii]